MIAKELDIAIERDAGGRNASSPAPLEEDLMKRLLPDALTEDQEVEAALDSLKQDQTGSAHLTPLLTSQLVRGHYDRDTAGIVLSHLQVCAWCPQMLRLALQLSAVPEDHPALALLSQTDPWFMEARQGLEHLLDLAEDWDGHGAEPPSDIALTGAHHVLEVLRCLNVRPDRIAPSAEGGIMLSFFRGKRYGDVELLNTGEVLAVTSDGLGNPTVWEVSQDDASLVTALETIRDHVRA